MVPHTSSYSVYNMYTLRVQCIVGSMDIYSSYVSFICSAQMEICIRLLMDKQNLVTKHGPK